MPARGYHPFGACHVLSVPLVVHRSAVSEVSAAASPDLRRFRAAQEANRTLILSLSKDERSLRTGLSKDEPRGSTSSPRAFGEEGSRAGCLDVGCVLRRGFRVADD